MVVVLPGVGPIRFRQEAKSGRRHRIEPVEMVEDFRDATPEGRGILLFGNVYFNGYLGFQGIGVERSFVSPLLQRDTVLICQRPQRLGHCFGRFAVCRHTNF
jgi:hypothetical protein